MSHNGPARRYNLFRRRTEQQLYCAVPEDRPVPPFVGGADWEYRGRLTEEGARPPGFRDRAAAAAASLTGYYLFQALGEERAPAAGSGAGD